MRTGEVSAVEIAEQSLARLEADTLGAVWVVTRERALAERRRSTPPWPPVATRGRWPECRWGGRI